MSRFEPLALGVLAGLLLSAGPAALSSPRAPAPPGLDARVKEFLERTKGRWHDLNVPYEDGQALHDLVVKNGFKRGLEIGTSTGLSAVWIGWAMSKTGGQLVTIEIDEGRHLAAKRNLEEAGVAAYVDARRADAHGLVKTIPGPFDFVFSDADKDWYPQYFKDLDPKLQPGGCFTAHNVLNAFSGIQAFLDLVRSRKDYLTEVLRTSGSGISVSCRLSPEGSRPGK
jgi:predicted O-methyltransferase YrrM